MKKLKLLIKVVVVCVCVLFGGMSMPTIVHAEGTSQIEPRMTYIYAYSTDLTISEDGVASVSGVMLGKSNVTSAYVKCTLQISVSGSWVDVKSWTDSNNGKNAVIAETYQLVSRGNTYRVVMTCRANTEEKEAISPYRTWER